MPDHDGPSAATSYFRLSAGLTAATVIVITGVFVATVIVSANQAQPGAFVISVFAALLFLILGVVVGCWGTARGLATGHCGQWPVREARAFWVAQCVLVCVGITLLGLALVFIL
jgi:hypothetical protein